MGRCLNLTKAGEYAIAALSRLALQTGLGAISAKTLAAEQKIPPSFLAKILSQCVKAGLVSSRKGRDGGIRLSRPADEITLLSIIEACEGPYIRKECVFYASRACEGPDCEVYCSLREQEEGVRMGLGSITLASMAEALNRHPNLRSEKFMEVVDGTSGRRD